MIDDGADIYSVSELTERIQQALTQAIPPSWVHGEISNFMAAQSGHIYFSLKDTQSQIRCVIWKTTAMSLSPEIRTQLTHGQTIDLYGTLTVYKPRGEYQLVVKYVKIAGTGELYARYLALKERLQKEGLFEAHHRPPLPRIPMSVGIITSLKAAGLRDILITLSQLRPDLSIILYPCQVQGDSAAPSIIQAIAIANTRDEVPLLILARGGGSLEDLWCFNEESVIRAIHASRIPIVTGIGHESDITLSDLVAHTRAATPTAAAQMISPSLAQLQQQWAQYAAHVQQALQQRCMLYYQHKDLLTARLKQHHVIHRLEQHTLRLTHYRDQLAYLIQNLRQRYHQRYQHLCAKLQHQRLDLQPLRERLNKNRMGLSHSLAMRLAAYSASYERYCKQLEALNPTAVLSRGYSITVTQRNPQSPLTADTPLEEGEELLSLFEWGKVSSLFKKRCP